MADDITILDNDGVAYAYPQEVKISPYTLTGDIRIADSWKRRILRFGPMGLLSERFLKLKIAKYYKVPDELIIDKNPVRKVFILRGYDKKRRAKKIEREATARALFQLSVGIDWMPRYIDLYCYLFGGIDVSNILQKMKEIIDNSFKNAECIELKTPNLEGYAKTISEIMG
jgi:hypothetical protein